MATIDSLDIKISAQASTANKAIGVLSQNLSTLSKNLGRLNGTSLSNFSTAMKTLSDGMKSLQGIQAKDFTPIASGIKKFENINAGKISSVGGSLKTLANGLNTISGLSFNAESLNGISSALNKLGSVKGTVGADNLLKIKNSLSQFVRGMNDIGSITFDTTNLSNLISSISRLGNTGANNATKNLPTISAQLQNFVRQLNKIGALSFDTTNLSNLITGISRLGYKGVTNAVTNLPALTRELNNLMTTLSRAPRVSNNIIQMTNALANLASQGSKVGAASKGLGTNLNNVSNSMTRLKTSTSGALTRLKSFSKQLLASAGIYLTLRQAIKGLISSIKSSMNYVEVLNYFDAAFTQVAEKADLSSFREMGYDSAEEYANSFSKRAKELTSQMTGFEVTESGALEATGMQSLGLNPSELMNYQAMFGQMASSMGVASETSLKMSRALTEIGADLASVKNMDFDKVWTDMASGLAGMSRTLDKYGVNIRNVNLQQKLNELGVKANISALNQNDKALLRTIILLDNTTYAWGDLADTINQPANQLRLVQASFQNLSRTIGGLFLPLVNQVLPYINALAIALERLFKWIGNILGVDWDKISEWQKKLGSGGSENSTLSDIKDNLEEVAGGYDDATKAAEKYENQILGFDEITKLQEPKDTDTSTSTGGGVPSGLLDAAFEDALSKYQQRWDEAFANMENRAQEMADKIEKALQPIKKIIQDFAIGDFFQAGQDVSNLVISINNFFANAIDNADWYKIGQNIGNFLAGINWTEVLSSVGNLIWKAITAAIDLWKGSFDAAPIETTIVTSVGLLTFTGLGKVILNKIKQVVLAEIGTTSVGTAISSGLLSSIGAAWTSLGGISGIFTTDLATIVGAGTATEIGLAIGTGIIAGIIAAVAGWNFGQFLYEQTSGEEIEMSFVEQIEYLAGALKTGELSAAIQEWWNNDVILFYKEKWNDFTDWWSNTAIANWWKNDVAVWFTAEKWTKLVDNIKSAFVKIPEWFENVFSSAWQKVKNVFSTGGEVFDGIKEGISNAFKNIVNKLIVGINSVIAFPFDNINKTLNNIRNTNILGIKPFAGLWSDNPIPVPQIPQFKMGGFPEDGWFRASKGEYFGQFDDGTSYIANNNQVESGIAAAVYPAVYNAVMAAMSHSNQNSNERIVIQLDGKVVYDNVIERARTDILSNGVLPIPI